MLPKWKYIYNNFFQKKKLYDAEIGDCGSEIDVVSFKEITSIRDH